MGACQYCGKSAGLLRSAHSECKQKHNAGWKTMTAQASEAIHTGKDLEALESSLEKMAESAYIPQSRIKEVLAQGWEEALNRSLDDNVLSEEEESRLMTFLEKLGLSQERLNAHGAYTRAAMAATLRDVLNGKTPSRVKVEGAIPFNLQKSETLVWLFNSVPYYEEKVRRSFTGGYQGMSVRVARGVYCRFGGFRGHPVETSQLEQIDKGMLGITTKHLYFAGLRKSFRIPYAKVVTFTPFSDAIGVCRDAASAKPQYFVTGEGWFIYNLVKNLGQQ